MTNEEIGWLAGLLEGEGCFSTYQKLPRISVAMTDRDVIERVAMLLEVNARGPYQRKNGTKPVFAATAIGYRAERIMRAILPFMGERRSEKIRSVLQAWNAREGDRKPEQARRGLKPSCHPDRPYFAKDKCQPCYDRLKYRIRSLKKALEQGSEAA